MAALTTYAGCCGALRGAPERGACAASGCGCGRLGGAGREGRLGRPFADRRCGYCCPVVRRPAALRSDVLHDLLSLAMCRAEAAWGARAGECRREGAVISQLSRLVEFTRQPGRPREVGMGGD